MTQTFFPFRKLSFKGPSLGNESLPNFVLPEYFALRDLVIKRTPDQIKHTAKNRAHYDFFKVATRAPAN